MRIFMSRRDHRLDERDRVLLIRLGAVGDVLRTLPALHLIRKTFPAVHLAWIVEDLSRELLDGHPEIDEVIRFPRREIRETARRPRALMARLIVLRRELRARRFTAAVDFQGSLKSGVLGLLSGAPRRIGFAPGHCREFSFLLTNEWVRPHGRRLNRVEKNCLLAEALGAAGDEIEVVLPERPEEGRQAESMVRSLNPGRAPLAVLSPGTSRRQAAKRWPPEYFGRLASLLAGSSGALPLVVFGPGEETLAREAVSASGGRAVLAPPTSLRLLAAVLRRSALFVGADTGPMHLAWAVGCPVVALFGPTDPALNAPLGPMHAVLREGRSTARINPDQAYEAARRLLPPRSLAHASGAPRLSRAALFAGASGPGR
jgi:lipopolysaccharide heptosyltransferase I